MRVTCDVEDFTMTVCYEPHEDITSPSFSMYANDYGHVEACKVVEVDPADPDTSGE